MAVSLDRDQSLGVSQMHTVSRIVGAVSFIAFSAIYFAACIVASIRSMIGTDEVFVVWLLRAFPASRMTDGLKLGLDSLPPGYYQFLHGVCAVLGQQTLAAMRLPSVISFYIFLFCIFWLVRKHATLPVAVLAMAVPCLTGVMYAYMARPYAIVAACFGLAAVVWNDDTSPTPRRQAVLTALILAVAIAVHFYSVLLAVVLGIAELTRSLCTRKIRWIYWTGLTAGAMSVLLWLPVILPIYRFTQMPVHDPGFYAKPSIAAFFTKLQEIIAGYHMVPMLVIFVVFVVPVLLLATHFNHLWPKLPAGPREDPTSLRNLDILAFASLLLPAITFVFARLVTGSFNTRYLLSASLGIGILVVRALRPFPVASLLAPCLLVLILVNFARPLFHEATVDPRIAILGQAAEPLPIVLPDAGDYFGLWESSPPPIHDRIAFVGMPAGVASPDIEPEIIAWRWKGVRKDLRVFHAEEWFARSPQFYLLYASDTREGLVPWLIQHAAVTVAAHDSYLWLFKVDVSGLATK